MNTALEGKKFLLGDDLSVADIIIANCLMYGFQTVLDQGFMKSIKNVNEWAARVFALPEHIHVFGKVQMCQKPLKPILAEAPKKEEKKKAAPVAAAPKKKVDEKPKSNTDLLPPSDFNIYDFKTFYINHPDKKGKGMDEAYKMIDWEGYSFWKFEYDIYEGEGEKVHMCNNLIGGFLSRAEGVSKICFARHVVLGDEPNLQIYGVWLVRGKTEVPDGLRKDHPSFEYYRSRLLDPRNNKEDDKLVRAYWGGNEGDVIDGKMIARTMKWFK